jgi:hypothetical protein
MEGSTKLSEEDPSVLEPTSANEIALCSNWDEVGFVVDMEQEEQPKSYSEVVNGLNGQVWKQVVHKKLDSIVRAGTWDVVGKIEGGKDVGSKWVFKMKRLAEGSINKLKGRHIAQRFTQYPGFDVDKTYTPVIHFDSLQLLLTITAIQD